mgnify:CR=1 FL=1
MQVGDLVTWRPDLPMSFSRDYGLVVKIINDYLVGVLWTDSDQVYMESIEHLEVISESWRFGKSKNNEDI